ncbi:MAG: hypothetical protein Q9183_005121 [Haloplaca sp. 2 TL-2023]
MQARPSPSVSDASTSEGSSKRKRSSILVPEPVEEDSDTFDEAAGREDGAQQITLRRSLRQASQSLNSAQAGTTSPSSDASTSGNPGKRKRELILVPEPAEVDSDTTGEEEGEGSMERGSEKRRRVTRSETKKGEGGRERG